MNKKQAIFLSLLIASLLLIATETSLAQCAMCKAIGESSLQENSTTVLKLNYGIMYLFMMPFVLVGTIAFFWYKNYKKAKANGAWHT